MELSSAKVFVIFGFLLHLISGKKSQPPQGRSRGPRHDVRTGNPHRQFRKTARLASDGYEGHAGPKNLAVTSENQTLNNTSQILTSNANQTSSNGTQGDNGLNPIYYPTNATSQAADAFSRIQDPLGGTNNDTQVFNISSQSNDTLSNSTSQNGLQPNGTSYQDGAIPNSYGNSSNSSLNSNTTDALPTTNGTSFSLPQNGMQKGGIFLGFLPDDGSSGGTRQTMAQLNSDLGSKAAVYGWYAQAHSGTPFDGSQLLAVIDDVKACNCVFQPAVMPIGGWQGLTSQDNSQAVAIAQVMKKFTDEGIPVWLRFAHEMNYYQTDGTYQGTAADFKAGWAAVADAIKKIAPSVKMWWTPNVSSAEDYKKYEPDDLSTVDLVGIDYYPKKLTGNDFIQAMQSFHDKYAVNGRKFAIGETGLGWSGTVADKTKWFDEICAAKSALPEFLSMAWFNFDKEYDYKIAGEPTLNQKFTALITNP